MVGPLSVAQPRMLSSCFKCLRSFNEGFDRHQHGPLLFCPAETGRWIPWFFKITDPSDKLMGLVVGAPPLTQHHCGGVGLWPSCHLNAPLGGTVSTSQDALVSRCRQKRLLSTSPRVVKQMLSFDPR